MPTVIELEWQTGGKDSYIYFYPLWDSDGKRSGQATTKKLSLFDVDGNQVGRQYIDCMATSHTGWVCTLVSVLKDGPYTDKGTVVATGVSQTPTRQAEHQHDPRHGRVRCVQQRRRAGDPGRGRREGQVQAPTSCPANGRRQSHLFERADTGSRIGPYLAADAEILDLIGSVGAHRGVAGPPEELRLLISLLEAAGYPQTLDACEAQGASVSGSMVECTFDFHLFGSDRLGLGPYGGSSFDPIVDDGAIV